MDGLEALQRIKASHETLPVVIISGHGTVSTAVEPTKARRVRLHREAARRASACSSTIRNALDQTRLRDENTSLKRAVEVRHQMVGEIAGAAPGVGRDQARRADQRHRAAARRERLRQGARRALDPPEQPAQPRALRAGQLRGDSRGADRVGAVRPREGLVHRRDREADRQVRAGRSRHDLPRRSRRHEPEDAGQGPARAAGGRGRAARLGADDQGGRARHRRDQQGSRSRRSRRARSARISTSA